MFVVWDQQSGLIELGTLPGPISTINSRGQVLIKSVAEVEDERKVIRPVIWENGKITKLKGLEGDLGIESEESYGYDMNDKGEVVGQSIAYLVYKNSVYKRIHAVKWVNGEAIDLHNTIPKTDQNSFAVAINDLGDIYISVGKNPENHWKLNNIGYLYKKNVIVTSEKDENKQSLHHTIFYLPDLNGKIEKDYNSVWMKANKIISVNNNAEIIVEAQTIWGEKHAMLLRLVGTQ